MSGPPTRNQDPSLLLIYSRRLHMYLCRIVPAHLKFLLFTASSSKPNARLSGWRLGRFALACSAAENSFCVNLVDGTLRVIVHNDLDWAVRDNSMQVGVILRVRCVRCPMDDALCIQDAQGEDALQQPIYSQPNVLGSTWFQIDSQTLCEVMSFCMHAHTHSLAIAFDPDYDVPSGAQYIHYIAGKIFTSWSGSIAASVVRREAEGTVICSYNSLVAYMDTTAKSTAQTCITHGLRTAANQSGPHAALSTGNTGATNCYNPIFRWYFPQQGHDCEAQKMPVTERGVQPVQQKRVAIAPPNGHLEPPGWDAQQNWVP
ncbi:hypothetical protein EDD22DRAFT_845246 [Suillus occidentalis]|nr:hypothetical protein EDD22DRAFT_845246 [Suillus occidentalis]